MSLKSPSKLKADSTLKAPATLPPTAQQVDNVLADIDKNLNWLYFLSPLHNDEMWETFVDSGFSESPKLQYPPLATDFVKLQEDLQRLPVSKVEEPLLEALFLEKQRELSLLIDLVRTRDSAGFASLSIEVFGGSEPGLLHTARMILKNVSSEEPLAEDANWEDMQAVAQQDLDYYRAQAPDFNPSIHPQADLNSQLMVLYGDLHISRSLRLPRSRIRPLVAHEVGTHMVSFFNGCQQPLKQLSTGLAHYDTLQEGLATLSEYLAGYLPPSRLRVIAARVIACDLAVHRQTVAQIFTQLREEYLLPDHAAFDVAVRACRGGGLTKDTVYLKGLIDVLGYLADSGDLEWLFIGKFALNQSSILQELTTLGLVLPPTLLPNYLSEESSRAHIERARSIPVEKLFQRNTSI